MRICYLCADRGIPLDGHKGASVHVRAFVRALCALGHDVCVVSAAPGTVPPADLQIVPVTSPPIISSMAAALEPRQARALAHLLTNVAVEGALDDVHRAFQPELIYERYSPFSAAGSLWARRVGVPHILEVNAPLAWEGNQYRNQALPEAAQALEQAAFAAAPLIVTVSWELRAWLIAAGVASEKIAVVPNGVDASLFGGLAGHSPRRAAGVVTIGFVGSLKPWHGLDVLVSAFRVLASDTRYRLLVVGDGPMAIRIRELESELPGRITFVGAVEHERVPEYLHAMDIAVAPYPARAEFYFSPLKVLEYMAAGRAVVASDIGQLRELIRHGETGVLVPAGDAGALAGVTRELADAPERRRELGRAAAAEVNASHTWQHRVVQVLQLVEAARREEVLCSP
jgi:glycosyltransferase involved in cell wall biosynthesis